MVRSTILLSAIIACIGSISAIPNPDASILDIDGGHHIGTDDISIGDSLNNPLSADNAELQDIIQFIDILGSGSNGGGGGGNGGGGNGNGGGGNGNGGGGNGNGGGGNGNGGGGNGGGNGGNGGNGGGRPINRPNRPNRRPHRPHRPFRPDVGGHDHVHGPGCGCMKRDNGIDLAKRGEHKHSSKGEHKGHTKQGKATMNKMDSQTNMD